MSKPRLPLSVLAALGLSATGLRCSPAEILQPCLSIAPMPHPEDDSDTSAEANQRNNDPGDPHVGPCLTPMREPSPDPDSNDPREEPPVEPCLSPLPEPEPEPEMTVCLSIAPPDRLPAPSPPTGDEKSAVNTVDKAKQAVLKRGILPPDVAARLLRDNKD